MPKKKWSKVVMWLMTIILPKQISRKKFIDYMKKNNVECRPMINTVSNAKHFAHLSRKDLMISEYISKTAVHLPSSSNLTKNQINFVSNLIMKYINN